MLKVSETFRLRSERITLREVTPEDAAGPWAEWMRDAETLRYTEARFAEHTPASLRQYAESMHESADNIFLAILDEDGRHIGNIKLGPVNWRHSYADIGLIIGDKASWGQGYATEAIGLVRDFAFDSAGLHKVTAGIVSPNTGSMRAFEKAGFSLEGRRKDHNLFDGKWRDVILMGCVNPRWRPAQQDSESNRGTEG